MKTVIPGEVGASMAETRLQLLGPVQLFHGDVPVPIGGPGVRGLLALLALKPGKVVGLDDIIDALWGHNPPATARTIVHGNVSHLRRILREVDGPSILTTPPGYRLDVEPDRIDVHRVRTLLDRASAATPETAAALLAEALALWQGPALGGVPESLQAPELEDLRLAVHGARVDADLELGRHAELIVELSPIVRADPLAERTAGQLMRALYHAGRRGDALELYRTVSRATLRTLGVEPGAELRWLHERVLNDDLPARERHARPPPTSRRKAISQLPAAVPSLAGRADELAWLDGLVTRAEAGETTIAVVTGTAGVGKSTLVVWWAHRVARRFPDGVLFASLRGFDPHHPPLEPAELLTQFLLGLGVETAKIPELLHERVALYRSLIAGRRMLVLLDDARTAEQVRPLLPPSARTMTVVTSRSRLDGLAVSNAAKQRVLGTLAPDDAVLLIEELAGPADLNHALARLCGYLPLALRIAGARLSASAQRTAEELVDELGNERTRLAGLQVDGADDGVRAAFDVSFRGLPGEIAETFLQLGAVPGVHGRAARDGRGRRRSRWPRPGGGCARWPRTTSSPRPPATSSSRTTSSGSTCVSSRSRSSARRSVTRRSAGRSATTRPSPTARGAGWARSPTRSTSPGCSPTRRCRRWPASPRRRTGSRPSGRTCSPSSTPRTPPAATTTSGGWPGSGTPTASPARCWTSGPAWPTSVSPPPKPPATSTGSAGCGSRGARSR